MSRSSLFIKAIRVALIAACGAVPLGIAGCGPSEVGSVPMPGGLNRGSGPEYDPSRAKSGPHPSVPGQFRVEPKSQSGRRRGA
jgi:hypothetical protein